MQFFVDINDVESVDGKIIYNGFYLACFKIKAI